MRREDLRPFFTNNFSLYLWLLFIFINRLTWIFVNVQDAERNLREQLSAAQHLVNRYQNELSGERLYRFVVKCFFPICSDNFTNSTTNDFRKEMETKTTTLCADNEKEVNIAKSENEECAKQLAAVDGRFNFLLSGL